MKLGEIVDEMFAEAEKGMKCLSICVGFGDGRTPEYVWFQQDRRRIVDELCAVLKKGGIPVGLLGSHETEMNGIWELRAYHKLWGKPWEYCEGAPRFLIGTKAELSKMSGIAPEEFDSTNVVIAAAGVVKPETRQ